MKLFLGTFFWRPEKHNSKLAVDQFVLRSNATDFSFRLQGPDSLFHVMCRCCAVDV